MEKRQNRYAIRKFTVGVGSVLVGTMMFMIPDKAYADTTTVDTGIKEEQFKAPLIEKEKGTEIPNQESQLKETETSPAVSETEEIENKQNNESEVKETNTSQIAEANDKDISNQDITPKVEAKSTSKEEVSNENSEENLVKATEKQEAAPKVEVESKLSEQDKSTVENNQEITNETTEIAEKDQNLSTNEDINKKEATTKAEDLPKVQTRSAEQAEPPVRTRRDLFRNGGNAVEFDPKTVTVKEGEDWGKGRRPATIKIIKHMAGDLKLDIYRIEGISTKHLGTLESTGVFKEGNNNIVGYQEGLSLKISNNYLHGRPYITDWKRKERERKYRADVTLTDDKGAVYVNSVYLIIKRDLNEHPDITDAEYYNPTPTRVTKPYGQAPSEDEIKRAVQVPPEANGSTIKVIGPIPNGTATGDHTVTAEVIYEDGTKDRVEVPVTIGAQPDNDKYQPTPTRVTKPYGQAPSEDEIKRAVQVPPEANGSTIAVVGQIPNGNATGDHTVTAEVTYADGTKDRVEVPVTIGAQPENDKYNPTPTRVTKPYGQAPSEDEIKRAVQVPPEANGSTIAVVGQIPNGNATGDHTVTAEVTYADGTKDRVEVPVTIGAQPENDKYNPTPTRVTKPYGQAPSEDEIKRAVQVPPEANGSTIAVVGQIPNGNATGDHNVPVEVTYADGTKDRVEVPVTIGKASDKYEPTVGSVRKPHGQAPSEDEIKRAVQLPPEVNGSTIAVVGQIPNGNATGDHTVPVEVTYPDGTKDRVAVPVTIGKASDKYEPTVGSVRKPHGQAPSEDEIKRAVQLPPEVNGSTIAVVGQIPNGNATGDHTVPVEVTYPDGTKDRVAVPVTIGKASDKYEPTVGSVRKPHGQAPSEDEIKRAVQLPPEVNGSTIAVVGQIPNGNATGDHTVPVEVTYPDGTKDRVAVPVTIGKASDKYEPTVGSVRKPHGQAPSEDEIKRAVQLPPEVNGSTIAVVGQIPNGNATGDHTVPVEVTYPDGTKDRVAVPVTIGKASDKYEPTVGSVRKPHGQAPSEDEIKRAVQLPPEVNGSTIAVVGQIPNGNATGDHTVPVEVTYPDGTKDRVAVPVTIGKASDKYEPTVGSVRKPHGQAPSEDEIKRAVQLPPEVNGSTIAVVGQIPNGNATGDHTVPVEVTYPDGTKDRVAVPVTIGKASDKYEPTVGSVRKPHGQAPSEDEIKRAVQLPPEVNGSTIAVVGQIPNGNATGDHTVPVEVTYPDGTKDRVAVPVTIGKASDKYEPTVGSVRKPHGQAPSEDEIKRAVQVPPEANGSTITVVGQIPDGNATGDHTVPVEVTYADGTKDRVEVPVRIEAQPDKDKYDPTPTSVTKPYGETPSEDDIKNAAGIPDGSNGEATIKGTIPKGTEPGNYNVPVEVRYPDGTTDTVEVPVTIGKQPDKDKYDPTPTSVTKPYGETPSEDDIKNAAGIPEGSNGEATIKGTIPKGTEPGNYNVPVEVRYPDGTTDTVEVPVTIGKQPDKDKYDPTPTSVTKPYGETPSEDDIKNAAGIPEGSNGEATIKGTIPKGTEPGNYNVPVEVRYPDGTTDTVEVPVTIGKQPDKDKYDPTPTSVTKPYGETPSEDDIKNAAGIPEGSNGEATIKGTIPKGTEPGNYNVPVEVRYPDGTTDTVEVPVTIGKQPDKDKYEPTPTSVTKPYGETPSEDEIKNAAGIPEGSNGEATIKGTIPKGTEPGNYNVSVEVRYPDGTTDTVEVPVTIKEQIQPTNPDDNSNSGDTTPNTGDNSNGGEQPTDPGNNSNGGDTTPNTGNSGNGGEQPTDPGNAGNGGDTTPNTGDNGNGGEQPTDPGNTGNGGNPSTDPGNTGNGGDTTPNPGDNSNSGEQPTDPGNAGNNGNDGDKPVDPSNPGDNSNGGEQPTDPGNTDNGGDTTPNTGDNGNGGDKPVDPSNPGDNSNGGDTTPNTGNSGNGGDKPVDPSNPGDNSNGGDKPVDPTNPGDNSNGGEQPTDPGNTGNGGDNTPNTGDNGNGGEQPVDPTNPGDNANGGDTTPNTGDNGNGGNPSTDPSNTGNGGDTTPNTGDNGNGGDKPVDPTNPGDNSNGGEQPTDPGNNGNDGEQPTDPGNSGNGGEQPTDPGNTGNSGNGGEQPTDPGNNSNGGDTTPNTGDNGNNGDKPVDPTNPGDNSNGEEQPTDPGNAGNGGDTTPNTGDNGNGGEQPVDPTNPGDNSNGGEQPTDPGNSGNGGNPSTDPGNTGNGGDNSPNPGDNSNGGEQPTVPSNPGDNSNGGEQPSNPGDNSNGGEQPTDPGNTGNGGDTTPNTGNSGNGGDKPVDPTNPGDNSNGGEQPTDPGNTGNGGDTTPNTGNSGNDGDKPVDPANPGDNGNGGDKPVDPANPGDNSNGGEQPTDPGNTGNGGDTTPNTGDNSNGGDKPVDPTNPGDNSNGGEQPTDPSNPGNTGNGGDKPVDPTNPGDNSNGGEQPTDPGNTGNGGDNTPNTGDNGNGGEQPTDPGNTGNGGDTTPNTGDNSNGGDKPVDPTNPGDNSNGGEQPTDPGNTGNGGDKPVDPTNPGDNANGGDKPVDPSNPGDNSNGGEQPSDPGNSGNGGDNSPNTGDNSNGGEQPTDPGNTGNGGEQPTDPGNTGNGGEQPTDPGNTGNGGEQPTDPGNTGNGGDTTPNTGNSGNGGDKPVDPSNPGDNGNGGEQPTDPGNTGNGGDTTPNTGNSGNGGEQPTDPGNNGNGGEQPTDPGNTGNGGDTTPNTGNSGNDGDKPVDPSNPGDNSNGGNPSTDPGNTGNGGDTTPNTGNSGNDGDKPVDPANPGDNGNGGDKPVDPANPGDNSNGGEQPTDPGNTDNGGDTTSNTGDNGNGGDKPVDPTNPGDNSNGGEQPTDQGNTGNGGDNTPNTGDNGNGGEQPVDPTNPGDNANGGDTTPNTGDNGNGGDKPVDPTNPGDNSNGGEQPTDPGNNGNDGEQPTDPGNTGNGGDTTPNTGDNSNGGDKPVDPTNPGDNSNGGNPSTDPGNAGNNGNDGDNPVNPSNPGDNSNGGDTTPNTGDNSNGGDKPVDPTNPGDNSNGGEQPTDPGNTGNGGEQPTDPGNTGNGGDTTPNTGNNGNGGDTTPNPGDNSNGGEQPTDPGNTGNGGDTTPNTGNNGNGGDNPSTDKDTTPPAKPTITTDLTGKVGTKEPITVEAEPGSTVTVVDKDGNPIGSAVANGEGVATITPTKPLPAGTVTATAKDPSGNTSASSEPISVTDNTAPAKPTITTDLTGKAGTKEPITVEAEPGSTVKVVDKDGNPIGSAVANNDGVATITPTKPLPAGNVTATAKDPSGNTSASSEPISVTDTTPPAKPTITTDLTGKVGTKEPITVEAEPGSTVTVVDKDGNPIGSAVANGDGVATITPTKPLPAGNVTATAKDPSGNTSASSEPISVTDTTAPAKPTITTDLTGKVGTKEPITVEAEPGSTVTVVDKDGNPIGSAVANNDGVATITPTKPLPVGNVTATAKDPSGNTSASSEPISVTDTTPPAKPTITTDLTDKAGTKEPITVEAEPGSTVTVVDKDGNPIGSAVANGEGVATITPTKPLPAGNVTATAKDPSGNTSATSEPISVTDTTPPAKPTITSDLTDKAGKKDPITVEAEPGSTVTVVDKDGNPIGSAVANEDGIATITPTKPLPVGNVTATAKDPSGNTSVTSEPISVTDTTPPAKPTITSDLTDKAGKKDPITVEAEPGSTVVIVDKDGNKIGEGKANEDGVATITPTKPLPAGTITVTATDSSGNISEKSEPVEVTAAQGSDLTTSNTNGSNQASNVNKVEKSEQPSAKDSNASNKAKELPDTGEKENETATLLGLTSLFGGLALLFRRKKSEDK
nr:Rib/alpha-like domain-containing protein [Mammaliicoccus sp. Marseille-Q6498]